MSEPAFSDAHRPSDFLTAKEAAALYGCTTEYMARLCRTGVISAQLVGRVWHIGKDDVWRLVAERGKARTLRSARLSRERKREYQAEESRAALYGAVFEAIAALPREQAILRAVPTQATRHKNGRAVADRAVAVAVALVAILGNYALVTGQGTLIMNEAKTLAQAAQQARVGEAAASLASTAPYTEVVASVRDAIETAYAFLARDAYAPDPLGPALMRPALDQARNSAAHAPAVMRAKVLQAEEICIGEVCLTEKELIELTDTSRKPLE